MRLLFLSFFLFCFAPIFGQSVVINGYAPKYVGQTVYVYGIEDYLSYREELMASGVVGEDSLFSIKVDPKEIQKVIVRSGNNHGYMLIQPASKYSIYFPDRDKYSAYRPAGNEVELAFLRLDSTDINYKILGFQRWVDDFIGNYYHLKSIDAVQFVEHLDRFKMNVEKVYKEDTSVYLKAHVRFALAGLDNIPNAAERNRYEKYDHYIRNTPVYYSSESYMTYISDFYQKMIPRLSSEGNQSVYDAVVRSSPSLFMQALGTEYTLSNVQVRELVMLKSLSEIYQIDEFPKTNILTILDSLSKRAMFKQHRIIAKNLIEQLGELSSGAKAPDFVLIEAGKETKTLQAYSGKHTYIHFMDPESLNSQREFSLLKKLHTTFGKYVNFISVYKEKELSEEGKEALKQLTWDVYALPESNPIWKNYQMEAFPQYSFIDAAGYVVASPALSPTPNGQYKTIDESFFYLKKTIDEGQ